MKLFYCGNFYKASGPIQPAINLADQPKIKLVYRGETYNYVPPPKATPKANTKDKQKVTLIYRGMSYEHTIPSPRPYQDSRAINWRWQKT
jgi:hypothetical protein